MTDRREERPYLSDAVEFKGYAGTVVALDLIERRVRIAFVMEDQNYPTEGSKEMWVAFSDVRVLGHLPSPRLLPLEKSAEQKAQSAMAWNIWLQEGRNTKAIAKRRPLEVEESLEKRLLKVLKENPKAVEKLLGAIG